MSRMGTNPPSGAVSGDCARDFLEEAGDCFGFITDPELCLPQNVSVSINELNDGRISTKAPTKRVLGGLS